MRIMARGIQAYKKKKNLEHRVTAVVSGSGSRLIDQRWDSHSTGSGRQLQKLGLPNLAQPGPS